MRGYKSGSFQNDDRHESGLQDYGSQNIFCPVWLKPYLL